MIFFQQLDDFGYCRIKFDVGVFLATFTNGIIAADWSIINSYMLCVTYTNTKYEYILIG